MNTPRRRLHTLALCSLIACSLAIAAPAQRYVWDDLAPVPGGIGYGGMFAGTSADALIVAGGANFPDAPPWQDGAKVWYGDVHVLEDVGGAWRHAGVLPDARAYGAAVGTRFGLYLLGGNDAHSSSADVLVLRWDSQAGQLEVSSAGVELPHPTAFHAAGHVAGRIYIATGQQDSDPLTARAEFWSWNPDPEVGERAWREEPAWPGVPRIKSAAVIASDGREDCFYLIGGEAASQDEQGNLVLESLREVWRFRPSTRAWERMQDLPVPLAAAAAATVGQSHLLVFSGSPGARLELPVEQRPEFPAGVLAYHTITDRWLEVDAMPRSVVTSSAVRWRGGTVIASGEVRPGVRTPRVQFLQLEPGRGSFGALDLGVLAAYLLLLVAVGFWFSRRERGADDFFLAGKRIPGWAAGLSIYATQLSAITFLAAPAVAYAQNWLLLPPILMILVCAPLVARYYLPFFRRLGSPSAYSYLEARFHRSMRKFGSASFLLFQVARMAIVVYLPALSLAAVTGFSLPACILLMGVLATLYTVLGGMEAVVWTDVVQALVLLGGLGFAIILVLQDLGGLDRALEPARESGRLQVWRSGTSLLVPGSLLLLLGGFFLQLPPYTTDQAVIQRYMSTRDEASARRGLWLNGLLSVPFGLLFFVLGACLYSWFSAHPAALEVGMKNDAVFPLFIAERMPAGIAGLLIAGVFAASMSSLDSSMHAISTSVCNDWLPEHHARGQIGLKTARWLTLAAGIVGTTSALLLSHLDATSQFLLFQKMLGLLGSGLAGMFFLGIFTRRASARGTAVGVVCSTALILFLNSTGAVHDYLYALFGIPTCIVTGYLASLALPGPSRPLQGLTWHTMQRGGAA